MPLHTRALFLFLSTILALVTAPLHAQVPSGTPPFNSFGGDPDTVNLASLNVHLNVAVLNKHGRGRDFSYNLTYDSSVWYPVTSGSQRYWVPVNGWGWNGNSTPDSPITGYLTYYYSSIYCYDQYGHPNGQNIYYGNTTYYDPSGTFHYFPGYIQALTGGCGSQNTNTYPSTTADGSGLIASNYAGCIIAPNGSVFCPPVNPAGGFYTSSLSDRNGNLITTDASGHFYDTLSSSASVLTVTGTGTPTSPRVYTYGAPNGNASYTVKYGSYSVQTNFGCSGVSEYGPTTTNLVNEIDLPDGSKYTFNYEPTLGVQGKVTGRLASYTLPTGGTISYTYTYGANGIECTDGSASGLNRSTPDTGSNHWSYFRALGSGAASTTTVTDPQSNNTVIQFQGMFETERQVYNAGNLLETIYSCYNGAGYPCNSTAVAQPFGSRTVTTVLPGSLTSQSVYKYNPFGYVLTEQDDYDYAQGAPGALLRKTVNSYASLGNISMFPSSVVVTDGSGHTASQTMFGYDQSGVVVTSGTPQHTSVSGSRGNLTSVNYYTSGSNYLTKAFTYFDTGNVQTATDVNGAQTTYAYGACGNSFPTSSTGALGTRYYMWDTNCTGGVLTSLTDENGKTTTTAYANDKYYWRPDSVTDPTGAGVSYAYQPSPSYCCPWMVASYLTFNNGSSVVNDTQYKDGLGRTYVDQHQQSPSSSTADSISYTFDANGRLYSVSMPCSVGWAGTCSTPKTTQTYDALNRPLVTTDGGGNTSRTLTYQQNDVLVDQPPGVGEPNHKQRQLEYDALGRLTSVCEITSATSGTCGQTNTKTGYWTRYKYDPLGNIVGVCQLTTQPLSTDCVQSPSSGQQTRTFVFDLMGRLTSEINAENGTTNYTYDTDSSCGSSSGDLVKRVHAAGDFTCYTRDALHRVTSEIIYNNANQQGNRYFVYDTATVNGQAMLNGKGRLVETYTAGSPTSTKITDLGISYTVRGEPSDVYESTPNSGGYYHIPETYWPNGAIKQISNNIVGLPAFNYTPDGQGRISSVADYQGHGLVTSTTFNSASLPTAVTYATGDSDAFAYDPNTNRMTQYQSNINGQFVTGNLVWNSNGTLRTLQILDAFNNTNNQTCSYSHDDLVRIANATCLGNSAQNSGFEQGLTGWSVGGATAQIVTDSTRAHSGDNYVQLSSPANGGVEIQTGYLSVSPGQQIAFGGWAYLESGSAGALGWWLAVYDANHNVITYVSASPIASSSWTYELGTYTIPSNGAYIILYAQIYQPTSSTVLRLDDGFVENSSVWAQSFSYDAFGNIAKSGSSAFAALYASSPQTNRMTSIAGSTPSYDQNGNVTNDFLHTYAWDGTGDATTIDGIGVTYDALGRMVEQARGTAYTQIVYAPSGGKLALMNGQTLQYSFVPLTGGAVAEYHPGGTVYYRHPDWLGSTRLVSTSSRTIYSEQAYGPFGEPYAQTGATDLSFTGMDQDTAANLYDFPTREYGIQGRWPSPDPAGLASVNPAYPQSWNRYAYVRNNPLSRVDPTGMDDCGMQDAARPARGWHRLHAMDLGDCSDGGGGGGGGIDTGGGGVNGIGDLPTAGPTDYGNYCPDGCVDVAGPGNLGYIDNSPFLDGTVIGPNGDPVSCCQSYLTLFNNGPSFADQQLQGIAPGIVQGAGSIGDLSTIGLFYGASAIGPGCAALGGQGCLAAILAGTFFGNSFNPEPPQVGPPETIGHVPGEGPEPPPINIQQPPISGPPPPGPDIRVFHPRVLHPRVWHPVRTHGGPYWIRFW